MKNYKYMILVYSLVHFAVDFASAYLISSRVVGTFDAALCILIYNFCAFAMQLPIGMVADVWNKNNVVAAFGCLMIIISYSLGYSPLFLVLIVGLGNAMFHIGGGIDILNISGKKLGALGVFVSPGAFGVYFGTILGLGRVNLLVPILSVLCLSIGAIWVLPKVYKANYLRNVEFSVAGFNSRALLLVLTLMSVVIIRSYVGMNLGFDWKGVGVWGIIAVCAVVFGKTFGGIIADKFGIFYTVLVSLIVAGVLSIFSNIAILGAIAIFLFNMTMPITLGLLASELKGAKGMSFGILTFALFLGYIPVYLKSWEIENIPFMFLVGIVLSLGLLLLGYKFCKSK